MSEFSSNDGGYFSANSSKDGFADAGADTPLLVGAWRPKSSSALWSVGSPAHGRDGLEGLRDILLAGQNNIKRVILF